MDLFQSIPLSQLPGTPLPEKLRPTSREHLLGQEKALAQVQRYVKSGFLPSLILWGPPGTGKTTLARVLAQEFAAEFISINAVESGAKLLKDLGSEARLRRMQYQKRTILFVDEIHRFNKSQQDVLLPFMESGDLTLIGATTENPSYELNRALLSRARLVVFERLDQENLKKLAFKAFKEMGLDLQAQMSPPALQFLLDWSDGDARKLLLASEEILSFIQAEAAEAPLSAEKIAEILGSQVLGYDKQSDQHYDVISAFIKSLRGSDADAALYYLARMLKGGEDPLFIARRLVILASEDVGNADPRALSVAIAGAQAVELIGLPEGAINLAQVVCYLASAPKSNRSYMGLKKAQELVETSGTAAIPLHLRSSKTALMKGLGYGEDYQYPHSFPKAWIAQNYWPEEVQPQSLYEPASSGFEKQISDYLKWLKS